LIRVFIIFLILTVITFRGLKWFIFLFPVSLKQNNTLSVPSTRFIYFFAVSTPYTYIICIRWFTAPQWMFFFFDVDYKEKTSPPDTGVTDIANIGLCVGPSLNNKNYTVYQNQYRYIGSCRISIPVTYNYVRDNFLMKP